jgi:hypothetical protein
VAGGGARDSPSSLPARASVIEHGGSTRPALRAAGGVSRASATCRCDSSERNGLYLTGAVRRRLSVSEDLPDAVNAGCGPLGTHTFSGAGGC